MAEHGIPKHIRSDNGSEFIAKHSHPIGIWQTSRLLYNIFLGKKHGKSVKEYVMSRQPARFKFSTLQQVCSLIPAHLVAKVARRHGVADRARSFSPWSHVLVMMHAHLAHACGLNDVCDAVRNHRGKLATVRGATPPSRNALSYANKTRSAKMAEDLFWQVLAHLTTICPAFGGRNYRGFPRRFKRTIHVVDSTTIKLVANCMDWARHKRRKAGAKTHMRLDLQSFLPRFAIVDTARPNDNKCARELCADIRSGEIVLFDKAYIDFAHLFDLQQRGVFWVTRAKENMRARCTKRLLNTPKDAILRDELIVLERFTAHKKHPLPLRRVHALVERDKKLVEMVFITNNLTWAPSSIAELYKSRWSIEALFKQLKQTLQLCDFLGHSKNAIQWQIWTALLVYVLLRFLAFTSTWNHSYNRLVALIRSTLWSRLQLVALLHSYGTAGGHLRMLAAPAQAYLPGLRPT